MKVEFWYGMLLGIVIGLVIGNLPVTNAQGVPGVLPNGENVIIYKDIYGGNVTENPLLTPRSQPYTGYGHRSPCP